MDACAPQGAPNQLVFVEIKSWNPKCDNSRTIRKYDLKSTKEIVFCLTDYDYSYFTLDLESASPPEAGFVIDPTLAQ